MRALGIALVVAAAGCHGAADPCADVVGTCVALTVESSEVDAVDALQITATGAVNDAKTSSAGRASLPIRLALELKAGEKGNLHLIVDGLVGGMVVGSGSTDTVVVEGSHTTATVTLLSSGGQDLSAGGGDMSGRPDFSHVSDGGDGGVVVTACDPAGVTGPQCQWRWQTPRPQGGDIKSVVAFSDADTYALTADNIILHRDATAWSTLATRPAAPSTGQFFQTVSMSASGGANQDLFIGASTSLAAFAYHSPDRGVTWTLESLPGSPTGFVGKVASDGATAVLPGVSGLIYVRDGGTGAWSSHTSSNNTFSGAAMLSSNAIVYGYNTSALITWSTDTGSTWTAATTITPSTFVPQGACIGAGGTTSFWVVGGSVILNANGPSPTTWTQQSAGTTSAASLSGCVATDSTHAWAFGDNGAVFVTSDGTNWTGVGTPPITTSSLTAGAHSSGAALTLAGTNGIIFRSTDGGASYTGEQLGPTDPASAIYGVAPGHVFAVGPLGNILRTVDDGTTWTKLAVPAGSGTTADLDAVWGSSASDIYAVGTGVAVHSADGVTFTKSNSIPAGTLLLDVWGSSTLGAFAVGTSGVSSGMRVVYRTTDSGTTWNPVTIAGLTGATGVVDTVLVIGSDVWVAGDGGNIYHSSDGAIFTQQAAAVTTATITKLRGVGGNLIALLATDPGSYLHTTNGGGTWTSSGTVFSDSPINIASQPDESAVYVFGSFNPSVVSTDQGVSFHAFQPDILTTDTNVMTTAFGFALNDLFVLTTRGIIHYGN